MGKVRVFYGHEGVVPPTGLRTRSAAPTQPEESEVDEIVADDPNGEPVEIVGELVESDKDESKAEDDTEPPAPKTARKRTAKKE